MNDFSEHDYGLVKAIREIKIMKELGEISTAFMPSLLDVIIPQKEMKDVHSIKNIFLVMKHERKDLRKTIESGVLNDIT